MNADALFHSIRLKRPSSRDAWEAVKALGARASYFKTAGASTAGRATAGRATAADPVVSFRSMVSSALVEPPRRLNWHPLALLDFALTGGVILAGGVCGWFIVDLLFGFLAW